MDKWSPFFFIKLKPVISALLGWNWMPENSIDKPAQLMNGLDGATCHASGRWCHSRPFFENFWTIF